MKRFVSRVILADWASFGGFLVLLIALGGLVGFGVLGYNKSVENGNTPVVNVLYAIIVPLGFLGLIAASIAIGEGFKRLSAILQRWAKSNLD